MTPNVADAAARVPFDAAQYTWVDMHDTPDIPGEELRTRLRALGHDPDTKCNFRSMTLPFEEFAFIWPAFQVPMVDPVLTIRRTPEKLTIYFWQKAWHQSTATITLTPHPDQPDADNLNISYDRKKYVIKSTVPLDMSGETKTFTHTDELTYYANGLIQLFTRYMTCLCAGVYGERRETYRCTANPANPKRIRKGKTPLYDWKTIVVETVRKVAPAQGGTHASPRQHDVRGHWVRGKAKTYWRKAHKRGDPSKGVIFHDYVTERIAA